MGMIKTIHTEGYLKMDIGIVFRLRREEFVQALLENDDRDVKKDWLVQIHIVQEKILIKGLNGKRVNGNTKLFISERWGSWESMLSMLFRWCLLCDRTGGEFRIQSVSIAYEHKIMMLSEFGFFLKKRYVQKEIAHQYELIKKGF